MHCDAMPCNIYSSLVARPAPHLLHSPCEHGDLLLAHLLLQALELDLVAELQVRLGELLEGLVVLYEPADERVFLREDGLGDALVQLVLVHVLQKARHVGVDEGLGALVAVEVSAGGPEPARDGPHEYLEDGHAWVEWSGVVWCEVVWGGVGWGGLKWWCRYICY
jgi:hypothetical protein